MIPLSKLIADRRVQLMGHKLKLPSTRPARKALKLIPDGGKKAWRSIIKEDLRESGINCFEALRNAGNCRNWRTLWPIAVLRLKNPGNQVTRSLCWRRNCYFCIS